MKRAMIQPDKCRSCPDCEAAAACDRNAFIREEQESPPWVDFYQCCGCMKCKAACTNDAIEEILQPCSGRARMSW